MLRLALLAALLLAAAPRAARAEVDRVALIELPRNLDAAVRTALEPWRVAIVVVDDPATSPGPSMPSSAERAGAIAAEHRAGAAVWLADDGSGSALWIFDADSQRITARRLASAPPYDDATAASVALSVKTLLRFSAVAPVTERAAPSAPPATASPPPALAAAPPTVELVARAGLRRRPTGAGAYEPRLGLGARLRTPALGRRLLVGAALDLGPGLAVDRAGFVGHLGDTTIGGWLAVELAPIAGLALTPSLGASLHRVSIDGTLVAERRAASARRFNPSLDAGLLVSVEVRGRLHVGIEARATHAIARQRYLVGGAPVVALPSIESEVSLIAVVPLS